jgi:hypothetical protein
MIAPIGCKVMGCDRPAAARGWCFGHYHRWARTGEVGGPLRTRSATQKPLGSGRTGVRGERNVRAKLTAADVLEIRECYASGITQASLAKVFGVSQPHVSDIVNGKVWRHLYDSSNERNLTTAQDVLY